jgi:hypothetical protein
MIIIPFYLVKRKNKKMEKIIYKNLSLYSYYIKCNLFIIIQRKK